MKRTCTVAPASQMTFSLRVAVFLLIKKENLLVHAVLKHYMQYTYLQPFRKRGEYGDDICGHQAIITTRFSAFRRALAIEHDLHVLVSPISLSPQLLEAELHQRGSTVL